MRGVLIFRSPAEAVMIDAKLVALRLLADRRCLTVATRFRLWNLLTLNGAHSRTTKARSGSYPADLDLVSVS